MQNSINLKQLVIFAFCFAYPLVAHSSLITFSHSSRGAGVLAGEDFAGTDFTITATADTATDREVVAGSIVVTNHASAFIDIAGLGEFEITTPTRTFVNQNTGPLVGFSRNDEGSDLVNGPRNSAFADWEMLSSIGPVAGSGTIFQWDGGISTSGGNLRFFDSNPDITFSATVETDSPPDPTAIPEPTSFAVWALIIVCLVGVRSRIN